MVDTKDTQNLSNKEFMERCFQAIMQTPLTRAEYRRRHPEYRKLEARMERAVSKARKSTDPDRVAILAREFAAMAEGVETSPKKKRKKQQGGNR